MRKRDIDAVYRLGGAIGGDRCVFHARPNGLPHPRLGMAVSRRHGNAPDRNKIKRRIREAFRLDLPRWPVGFDVVVIPRVGRADFSVEEMRAAFSRFVERALRRWADR
jgi:ribonuclease P protein component